MVLGGVGGAVVDEGGVAGVVAAAAVWEEEAGGPEVCAVEENETVANEELHVHGGDPTFGNEGLPPSCRRGADEDGGG